MRLVVAFDVAVSVPLAAAAAINLHETDAALDQPPGQQAAMGEFGALLAVQAVFLFDLVRLAGKVHGLRGGGLHPERQLVGGDSCRQIGIVQAFPAMALVQLID